MSPDQAQESSERDQLWASLRSLRPVIEHFAAGNRVDGSDLHANLVSLLARIVLAEMDFRARDAGELSP